MGEPCMLHSNLIAIYVSVVNTFAPSVKFLPVLPLGIFVYFTSLEF